MVGRRLVAAFAGCALGFGGLSGVHLVAPWSTSVEPLVVADAAPPMWSDRFPDLLLQTHEGRTVRFYEDLIKDKIVAINFMYVGCTEF